MMTPQQERRDVEERAALLIRADRQAVLDAVAASRAARTACSICGLVRVHTIEEMAAHLGLTS